MKNKTHTIPNAETFNIETDTATGYVCAIGKPIDPPVGKKIFERTATKKRLCAWRATRGCNKTRVKYARKNKNE